MRSLHQSIDKPQFVNALNTLYHAQNNGVKWRGMGVRATAYPLWEVKRVQTAQNHTLTLEGRARAFITGVEDVDCFNEEVAVITTSMGAVTITGAGLKVSQLDLAQGSVALEGRIDALEYGAVRRGGFFTRVFK